MSLKKVCLWILGKTQMKQNERRTIDTYCLFYYKFQVSQRLRTSDVDKFFVREKKKW